MLKWRTRACPISVQFARRTFSLLVNAWAYTAVLQQMLETGQPFRVRFSARRFRQMKLRDHPQNVEGPEAFERLRTAMKTIFVGSQERTTAESITKRASRKEKGQPP